MNINVNIDIDGILGSINIKDLEQYIRRRKLSEILKSDSDTNNQSSTISINLNNKINLKGCSAPYDELEDDDLFGISDSNIDFEF